MNKFRCYTLFDITKSNIVSKKNVLNGSEQENDYWQNMRNTQCNFDTIIQVISLRAQPENISNPIQHDFAPQNLDFGFLYNETENMSYWTFDFSVNYRSVFSDGSDDLGALYNDCISVPMIQTIKSMPQMPAFLDLSPEFRNIYFKILDND